MDFLGAKRRMAIEFESYHLPEVALGCERQFDLCGERRTCRKSQTHRQPAGSLVSGKERAKTFGATHTINTATDNDPVKKVMEITGLGVDYAFDAVSVEATQALAFNALAPGGHSVAVGISAMTVRAQYSPFQMVFTEKMVSGTYYGSVRPNIDFPVLVDHYMNKKLNIDGLISRTYKLQDINEGFKRMLAGEVARGVVVFD